MEIMTCAEHSLSKILLYEVYHFYSTYGNFPKCFMFVWICVPQTLLEGAKKHHPFKLSVSFYIAAFKVP